MTEQAAPESHNCDSGAAVGYHIIKGQEVIDARKSISKISMRVLHSGALALLLAMVTGATIGAPVPIARSQQKSQHKKRLTPSARPPRASVIVGSRPRAKRSSMPAAVAAPRRSTPSSVTPRLHASTVAASAAQTAPSPALPSPTVSPATLTSSPSRPSPSADTAPRPTPGATPKPSATPAETLDDEDEVIRVTSNLVVVPVSVTDAAGEPVRGLQKGDFRLEEEGRAQEVAEMGDPDQVPLEIAILFDVSSSVTQKSFFTFQQESAVRFLKQVLKPVDRAAVFTISDKPRLEQPLSSAEAATAKLLAIPAAKAPTPTAFYDTVRRAAKYLADNTPGRHRRVIVVITDGDDNFSEVVRESTVAEARADARGQLVPADARRNLQERHRRAIAEVERAVQQADAVFYAINPGGPSVHLNEISMRAQAGMQQVADTTGGSSFVPEKLESLDAVFRQIAAELRGQYLLQYYSNSDAPPGKYLSIKVRTPARAELRVRARQGYYVPKPK